MNKVLKRYKPDLLLAGFLIFLVLIFFNKFFFPNPSLLYTVEPIGSDLLSVNYPAKIFMSQSIKSGVLPLWSENMGNFPIFSEGQIGTFYLPNLILYFLLPTPLALDINYLLVFILLTTGTYCFSRSLGISRKSSVFASISFSFGGYFIARMVHTAPLQTMSLLPWVFLFADRLWEKRKVKDLLLFIFVFSQQILAGHPQWVFITLLGYGIYKAPWIIFKKVNIDREKKGNNLLYKLILLIIGIILSLGVSAVQLIPTYEYLKQSSRSGGILEGNVFYSENPILNLYRFVKPSYFGNNKYRVEKVIPQAGLTWEEEVYIGILPLILLLGFIFKKKNITDVSLAVLLVLSLLLVLGKNSPLSFLHNLPPFSFFRMTSRYLILVTFSICLISARVLDYVSGFIYERWGKATHKIFCLGVLIALIFDLGRFGYNYHSYVTVNKAWSMPSILSSVEPGKRIFTTYTGIEAWRKTFSIYGYGGSDEFLYLKNLILPGSGEIWDRSTVLHSYGFKLKRGLDYDFINPGILDIFSVDYIISPSKLDDENLEKITQIDPPGGELLPSIYLYKNVNSLGRVRIYYQYKTVQGIDEAKQILQEGNIDKNVVILESPLQGVFLNDKKNVTNTSKEAEIIKDGNTEIGIKVDSSSQGILVLADSYYPGWKAYLNGNETEIFAANLNQRAIVVPAGRSEVVFKYEPESLRIGKLVTGVTLVILLLIGIGSSVQRLKEGKNGKY